MSNDNWDDNVALVLVEIIKAARDFCVTFKWPLSIAIFCLISYLGWVDVPVFQAIVDSVVGVLRELPGAPAAGGP